MNQVIVTRGAGTVAVGCDPDWCGSRGVIDGEQYQAVVETLGEEGLLVRVFSKGVYVPVEHEMHTGLILFNEPRK